MSGPGPRARRRRVRSAAIAVLVTSGLAVGCSSEPRTSTPEPPVAPEGISGSWALSGADEFDGSSLDREVWQPNRYGADGSEAPFNPDSEGAAFDSSNVSVADGNLVLSIAADPQVLDGLSYDYTSGVVQLVPQRSLTPGTYVEARIRVPECDGCWPAFWAVSPQTWPPEIDVMEFFDTATQSRPMFNYIAPDQTRTGPDAYGDEDTDYRDEYHVYGLLWDGVTATPVIDGIPADAVTARDVTDLDLSIILNLSVRRGAQPDLGAQMLVDWVRVWSPTTAG